MIVEKLENNKYKTTDGRTWVIKEEAEQHQSILNRSLRLCSTCQGGKLNEHGQACVKCKGRGYQQLLLS